MGGRIVQSVLKTLDRLSPARNRAAHLYTGERGEEAAYFHLRKLGYVMVARNYRSPKRHGEIDLIGWDKDVLCFIEGKTRTSRTFIPAEAAVDFEKRNDLRSVAREYLLRMEAGVSHRFDVISIYYEPETSPDITLFRNAFSVK